MFEGRNERRYHLHCSNIEQSEDETRKIRNEIKKAVCCERKTNLFAEFYLSFFIFASIQQRQILTKFVILKNKSNENKQTNKQTKQTLVIKNKLEKICAVAQIY